VERWKEIDVPSAGGEVWDGRVGKRGWWRKGEGEEVGGTWLVPGPTLPAVQPILLPRAWV
jgi:hypothetical protein